MRSMPGLFALDVDCMFSFQLVIDSSLSIQLTRAQPYRAAAICSPNTSARFFGSLRSWLFVFVAKDR